MSTPRPIVVGLGELLWDLFPSGKQLGGAPANFAYTTALLGDSGCGRQPRRRRSPWPGSPLASQVLRPGRQPHPNAIFLIPPAP